MHTCNLHEQTSDTRNPFNHGSHRLSRCNPLNVITSKQYKGTARNRPSHQKKSHRIEQTPCPPTLLSLLFILHLSPALSRRFKPAMSNPTNRPLAIAKSRLPSAVKPASTRAPPLDPYEEREIRNRAARVLENEEMLLLLSRQRYEVIFCLSSKRTKAFPL
jgi:hypothetical protein